MYVCMFWLVSCVKHVPNVTHCSFKKKYANFVAIYQIYIFKIVHLILKLEHFEKNFISFFIFTKSNATFHCHLFGQTVNT